MTPSELELVRKKYPVGPGVAACNRPETPWLGKPDELQKHEVDIPPKRRKENPVHRDEAGAKRMDEAGRPTHRVSIVFRVSDKRRRDNPGMLETLCDVLVAARRRLAEFGNRARYDDLSSEG